MAKSRRSYKGAAVSNTLGTTLSTSTATSINLAADMSGWPTGTNPFFVVIEPGTAKEEKVCVVYTSAKILTVVDPAVTSGWTASANGRGADDTTARAHDSGAVVYPVFTATEADQANELVSKYTTNGDIVVHGTTAVKTISTGGSGGNNKVLVADSTVTDGGVKWSTIVDANVNASAAIALSKLATGALPTAITVASANLVNGTIVEADLADGAVTSAKILDGAVDKAKIGSGPRGVVSYTTKTSSATSFTGTQVKQIDANTFTAVTGRSYKISYYEPALYGSLDASYTLKIYQGTTVSGTVLNTSTTFAQTLGYPGHGLCIAIVTNLSGTINLIGALSCTAGTGEAIRSSTEYAFILVEDLGIL